MSAARGAKPPARIPLARPALGDAEIAAAEGAIRSGRLVLGPENLRFEAALAARTGRKHAVCVTSGTTALELGLWALGIGAAAGGSDTDEVLVPAAGFPAAVNAILRLRARPVAVDVRRDTWAIDLDAAAAAVTPRSRALVAIDPFGLVAGARAATRFAAVHQLALIDDAACGLGGADEDGVAGGGYGVMATLSFHPRKVITTGEGGAIVCDDDDLAEVLRSLRNQGQRGRGEFVRAGTNARLPEPSAAMGAVQLDRLDAMLAERHLLAAGYFGRLEAVRETGRASWQALTGAARHTRQTFGCVLRRGGAAERDGVIAALAAADIEAGPLTFALGRLAAFAGLPGVAGRATPIADELHVRGLALPLWLGMRSEQLDRVCDILRRALP